MRLANVTWSDPRDKGPCRASGEGPIVWGPGASPPPARERYLWRANSTTLSIKVAKANSTTRKTHKSANVTVLLLRKAAELPPAEKHSLARAMADWWITQNHSPDILLTSMSVTGLLSKT